MARQKQTVRLRGASAVKINTARKIARVRSNARSRKA